MEVVGVVNYSTLHDATPHHTRPDRLDYAGYAAPTTATATSTSTTLDVHYLYHCIYNYNYITSDYNYTSLHCTAPHYNYT